MANLKKYACVGAVKYDGEFHAAGETVALPKDVAAMLIAAGAIENPAPPPPPLDLDPEPAPVDPPANA